MINNNFDRLKYFNLSMNKNLQKTFDDFASKPLSEASSFSGSASNYLTTTLNEELEIQEEFSFGIWTYYNSVSGNKALVHNWDGAGFSHELFGGHHNFVVTASDGVKILADSSDPVINQWYFLVGTINNTHIKLYSNGNLVDSESYTAPVLNSGNTVITVGGRSDPATGQLNGRLAGAFKYDRALTQQEIVWLYNRGMGRTYTGLKGVFKIDLISWWDLSESTGTRNDSHGNNDLTLNGTVAGADGPGT